MVFMCFVFLNILSKQNTKDFMWCESMKSDRIRVNIMKKYSYRTEDHSHRAAGSKTSYTVIKLVFSEIIPR